MREKKKPLTEEWMTPSQKEIVLDESLVWQKNRFKSTDGYWVEYKGGKILGRISDISELPPGAIIEKNAWNHEHCSLCWETISEELNYQHEGFTNGKDWLCEKCYKEYIE
jgi:hypothetical protein